MARCKDFIGWTYAECKGCGNIFAIYDEKGDWNDLPPDRKFYCKNCVKLGYKNKKLKETPDEFLKANCVNDKDTIREFKRRIKNFKGKRLNYQNVLKEAIEVANYKKENKND